MPTKTNKNFLKIISIKDSKMYNQGGILDIISAPFLATAKNFKNFDAFPT